MGALLQEGVRSMLFDNVERVMEWGQTNSFTILLLTTQEMSQIAGSDYFV